MVNPAFWQDKKVLVTGHTGFKGSWLSFWLDEMGTNVFGYALEPDTQPSLFDQLELKKGIHHKIADIRQASSIRKYVQEIRPDVVIHMAAQPLVLRSYREPAYTWEVNVMGSIHLMEALKDLQKKCAVIMVTTDKVYENSEQNVAYKESDRLGGRDPYSSGKAAAEIAVNSWRESFMKDENRIRIATARAGNVIGGGDWSENRIVPDLIRALTKGDSVQVRNPVAVRPWQHVLEPLSGYLVLAQHLTENENSSFQTAFNFGPLQENSTTVKELVEEALKQWPGTWENISDPSAPHEAGLLRVNIEKAQEILGWSPRWNFKQSVEKTVEWYKKHSAGANASDLVREQILDYTKA